VDTGVLVDVVLGLLPTVGVSALFAVGIWSIVRADASERSSRARLEAEEDAAAAAAHDRVDGGTEERPPR